MKGNFYPDEDTFKKVQGLYIEIRRIIGSLFPGHHRSSIKGRGSDFIELRSYSFGDDLRDIDWKVSGRRDRFMVRVREDTGRVNLYLCLDDSISMDYGEPSKKDFAIKIAGVIGCIALSQSDKLFFKKFSGDEGIPPLSTRDGIPLFLSALLSINFSSRRRPEEFISELIRKLEKPAKVVLVSDMMDEKMETIFEERVEFDLIHILSPQEEKGFDEEGRFIEPEDGEKLDLDFSSIKKEYAIEFERWRSEIEDKVLSSGGIYIYAPTYERVEEVILRYIYALRKRV